VPIDVIALSFGKTEETISDWLSNPCLISLDEALRRVKRKECLPPLNNSQPLVTTAEEDEAIRKVTKVFRNEFEHFAPKGWIAFTSDMPDNVRNLLRVIRFLVFESNCVTMSPEQEQRLNNAIEDIERLLNP
jgi:hypothetical protein